jgi:hypothetical protein
MVDPMTWKLEIEMPDWATRETSTSRKDNMTATLYIPTERAKSLRRFINAHRLWHRKCAALTAAEKLGTDTPEFAAASLAWDKGRMPSKRSKHWAYDDAGALSRYIGHVTGEEPKRATTVDGLAATLRAFETL